MDFIQFPIKYLPIKNYSLAIAIAIFFFFLTTDTCLYYQGTAESMLSAHRKVRNNVILSGGSSRERSRKFDRISRGETGKWVSVVGDYRWKSITENIPWFRWTALGQLLRPERLVNVSRYRMKGSFGRVATGYWSLFTRTSNGISRLSGNSLRKNSIEIYRAMTKSHELNLFEIYHGEDFSINGGITRRDIGVWLICKVNLFEICKSRRIFHFWWK